MGTWTVNEEFWLQATVQRLLAVEGHDWRQRAADIVEDTRRLFKDRVISPEAYEVVEDTYLGRLARLIHEGSGSEVASVA
jgi:hypothetical protein